jgi:hypothetical protein
VVAALLQTSQQLQAAVAQLLPGQLPVVMHARKLQQVTDFAHWLQKHKNMLQTLAVHAVGGSSHTHNASGWRPAAEAALTAATLSVRPLPLRVFVMTGALASAHLLQQLPAAQLTQLRAEVDMSSRGSMTAVRALSNLCSLDLYDPHFHAAATDSLLPGNSLHRLAAGLQQLIELRLGIVRPELAFDLMAAWPPQLQQLHLGVIVYLSSHFELLAVWLQRFASVVSSLRLYGTVCFDTEAEPEWIAAWAKLVAALDAWQAAAAEPVDEAASVWERTLAADSRAGSCSLCAVCLALATPASLSSRCCSTCAQTA